MRSYFVCVSVAVLLTALLVGRSGSSIASAAQSAARSPVLAQGSPYSAREMSVLFPRSESPASFRALSLPKPSALRAVARPNLPGRLPFDGATAQSLEPLEWSRLSASASQVAVAPDGSIWALSGEPRLDIDKSIWHYANGAWTKFTGHASSIAVGPTGTVYVVEGASGGIWANDGSRSTYLGGGARSIAAGADGAIYILSSTNVANGNSAVWMFKNGIWVQQPGLGSKLASSFDPDSYQVPGVGSIAPNGYFLLTSGGGVFYRAPGARYVQFPGSASGVAAMPGGLFELNYPASASGDGLTYFDYATAGRAAQPGRGVTIATGFGSGAGTQLYAVSASDALWTTPVNADRFNDYTTFGYDNGRDVFNPNSTAISPASLPRLHLAWQAALNGGSDFTTQTQPILATGIPGHRGVLFVGGGSGNVYAYDATTGALLWTKNFGQAIYPCGPMPGYFGTGGTVAYDSASRSLYVTANANASPGAYPYGTLYHLDAATGAVLGSVVFTPTAAGPQEFNITHTAVTLSGGVAYVGTGSLCDTSSWRGRVVAIDVPSMTVANTFFTLWDPANGRGYGAQPWSGGGIWSWGGVSLDHAGNVLTSVGNGDTGDSYGTIVPPFVAMPAENDGFSEAILKLSGNLATVLGSNHPTPQNFYTYSSNIDQQGTPVVFTPPGCGTMVAGQGKSGQLSLFDESSLRKGPIAQYQMSPSSSGSYFIGEPAYSRATGLVYSDVVTSTAPSLFAPGLIAIDPGCGQPTVAWQAAFGSSAEQRSVPAASAGGVVFAGSGASLWALDAITGAVLNGGQPFARTLGPIRMPATIDGNWIYVIDNNGNLYGFTTDSRFASIKAQSRVSTARQRWRWTERHRE